MTTIRFSARSDVPRPSAWAEAVSRARADDALLDLTSGNPTAVEPLGITPEEAAQLRDALAAPSTTRYAPSPLGATEARQVVAQHFAVDASRVILTASTSEAYAHLFGLLAGPGEAVLAPAPSYPLLPHLAAARDVRVESYPLDYDGSWYIDGPRFRAAVATHQPRAIVSVSPNNPTGSWLGVKDGALVAKTGLPLILDEVFAAYPLGAQTAVSRPETPLTVRLGGLSKYAGLPQVKLAWMLLEGDDEVVHEAIRRLEVSLDAFLSVSASAQADVAGLLVVAERRRRRIQAVIRENLDLLRDAVAGTSVTLLEPQAGWYAILRLPSVLGEESFAQALVDVHVLVQPGWLYDLELPGPAIVVSLLTPRAVMRTATTRMLEVVERASR